jgi:hypothetical protein
VITARAVYCALRRVSEDVLFEGGLTDFFGDGGFFGERLAGGFVFDEFEALKQAEAADLADVGMGFEGGERSAERVTGGTDAIEEFLRFQIIENGVPCGGGDRMRLISEAVHEGGGAFFKSVDDAGSDEDCAEGRVTTRDSLSGQNDVGLEAPMLAGEWLARAAHAGHDFVSNQEDVVAAADFGDASSVTVNGGSGTERSADYGFEDEGGDGGGVVGVEKNVEVIGASYVAFGIRSAKWAVVAEAWGDVAPFGDHGRVGRAAADVAADGHGAECASVVALLAGDNAKTRRLFGFEKILTREFDGGFGGFGAAGGEVDAAAVLKIARSDGEDASGELFSGFGVELGGVGEGDATRLLGHGAADFGYTVTNADDSGLTGGVEVAAAVGGNDPATFAADGDGIVFAKIPGKKRGGVDGDAHWKIVAEAAERRVEARRGSESQVGREQRGGGILFRGLGG